MATTYTAIATTSFTGSTVSFTSIPQTYTDLVLVTFISQGSGQDIRMKYNNSSTGYSQTWMRGDGSAANSSRNTSQTYINFYPNNGNSSTFDTWLVQIQNYSNTTTNKVTLLRGGNSSAEVVSKIALWQNTSAIDQIDLTLTGSAVSGSTATLYGIKAA